MTLKPWQSESLRLRAEHPDMTFVAMAKIVGVHNATVAEYLNKKLGEGALAVREPPGWQAKVLQMRAKNPRVTLAEMSAVVGVDRHTLGRFLDRKSHVKPSRYFVKGAADDRILGADESQRPAPWIKRPARQTINREELAAILAAGDGSIPTAELMRRITA